MGQRFNAKKWKLKIGRRWKYPTSPHILTETEQTLVSPQGIFIDIQCDSCLATCAGTYDLELLDEPTDALIAAERTTRKEAE